MRRIRREALVLVDPEAARNGLRHMAAGRRLAVRPVCRVPALGADVGLMREVVVTLDTVGDERWAIAWQPADSGPFPRFAGTLRIVADAAGTRLRLDGTYEDVAERRAGTVGALGFRLIQATAAAVLEALANGLSAATHPTA